eukprot:Gb_06346 [translate_table: standard]
MMVVLNLQVDSLKQMTFQLFEVCLEHYQQWLLEYSSFPSFLALNHVTRKSLLH